jgi:ribosome-binding factor A
MGKHSSGADADPRTSRGDEGHPTGHRHERLSRLLHEELDALVRDELHDPRVSGAAVTYVELSVDYKNARVGYVAPLGDRQRVEPALARATPFLRARLADAVDLKQVPALRFVWDALAATSPTALD